MIERHDGAARTQGKEWHEEMRRPKHFVDPKTRRALNIALVQFTLVLTLNSVVMVFKNSIFGTTGFTWEDCLSKSITLFAILFMAMFKNDRAFNEWRQRFTHWTNNLLYFLAGLSAMAAIYVVDTALDAWVATNGAAVWQLPLIWTAHFFFYFAFTIALLYLYFPVVLSVYDVIQRKYIEKRFGDSSDA